MTNPRPGRACAALLALACLALAACGGGDSDEPVAEPAATTSAAPTSSAVPGLRTYDVKAALARKVAAEVKARPIDPRVLKRFNVRGGPDWLAVSDGSLWLRTGEGFVLRLDPKSYKQLARIRAGTEVCQGLGSDDTVVWTCAEGGDVVRIDPRTNKVVARLAVDKMNDQGQIPVAFGRAWVLTGDGSTLVAIAGDKIQRPIKLGTTCIEASASPSAIWLACPKAGRALRVDPGSGAVTARVTGLKKAFTLAAGEAVWVGFSGGLAKLDEVTGEVLGVADASPGQFGGVVVTPDALWVRAKDRFLRKVDPAALTVLEELSARDRSGGAVILFAGSLWATAYDDDALYRLKL